MNLILGSGKNWPKQEGDVFVDIRPFPGVDVVLDLNTPLWPFQDNSVDSISAIHLVEHLHDLVNFMNECWRILKPGCYLYIETPLAGADPDLEFSDPTHIRCYRLHTFRNYFAPSGIEKFGYTDRPWNFICTEILSGCIIKIEANPIKI